MTLQWRNNDLGSKEERETESMERESGEKGVDPKQHALLSEFFRDYGYGTILESVEESDKEDLNSRIEYNRSLKFFKNGNNRNLKKLFLICLFVGNSWLVYQTTNSEANSQETLAEYLPVGFHLLVFKFLDLIALSFFLSKIQYINTRRFILKSCFILTLIAFFLILFSPKITSDVTKIGEMPVWVRFTFFYLFGFFTRSLGSVNLPLLFDYQHDLFPSLIRGKVFSFISIFSFLMIFGTNFLVTWSRKIGIDPLAMALWISGLITLIDILMRCFGKKEWIEEHKAEIKVKENNNLRFEDLKEEKITREIAGRGRENTAPGLVLREGWENVVFSIDKEIREKAEFKKSKSFGN